MRPAAPAFDGVDAGGGYTNIPRQMIYHHWLLFAELNPDTVRAR